MKCKNCEYEQEKDFKHCPECGLSSSGESVDPRIEKANQAYKNLEDINANLKAQNDRLKNLEDYNEQRKKERDDRRKAKEANRGSKPAKRKSGFLDIF